MAIIPSKKYFFLAIAVATGLSLPVLAEPIVILEYRQTGGTNEGTLNTHPFRLDPDYSTRHRVRKDETLSHIIANFYGGSDIDRAFVQMAIIRKNKSAFVRSNPHYLYADKVLHLPSLNEIRAMLVKQPAADARTTTRDDSREHIFYFGG
jgi:hypothetical protein